MTREILLKLDAALKKESPAENLLISKRGYYFYWKKSDKCPSAIRIHRHDCGYCAWGSGKIRKTKSTRTGRWIGPFRNIALVKKFIRSQFRRLPEKAIVKCSCTE
ncbi:MAG TPA: hypothetical protein VL651_13050 [Bacteroidia bacterium]|nr:hypothetical protein [Bacteroidia bacterium]